MAVTLKPVLALLAVFLALPFALAFLPSGLVILIPLVLWALPKTILGGDGEGVGPLHLTRRTLLQLELLANSNGKKAQ